MDLRLQQEYLNFLEREVAHDTDFVMNEMHYMTENCNAEGLKFHIPLHPLFLTDRVYRDYEKLGSLLYPVLSRTLELITDFHHPACHPLKEILRVDPVVEQMLHQGQPKGEIFPAVIRPDTVLFGDSFKVHEVNVSWPGGIADSDIIQSVLHQNSLYMRFRNEMNTRGVNLLRPPEDLSSNLLTDALVQVAQNEEPYIVMLIPRPHHPGHGYDEIQIAQRIESTIRSRGFEVDLIFADELEYDGCQCSYGGRVPDVAYRIFEWHHVLGDNGTEGFQKIVTAFSRGHLACINSFYSEAISAKSLFEIIWGDQFKPFYAEGLLEELRRFVPKTFNVAKASDAEIDWILGNKDECVIKPVKGSCGRDVFLGRMIEDEDLWASIVRQSRLDQGMVLQEYVPTPSLVIPMIEGQHFEWKRHYMDVNPFYIMGRMGNFFARWSKGPMTAQCGPGQGGMFPVVATDL